MIVTPFHYLLLGAFLFVVGLTTVVVRRHPLVRLVGTQLALQAVNLVLAALTSWFQGWSGQVAFVVISGIAVVELAVGLSALLVQREKQAHSINHLPE